MRCGVICVIRSKRSGLTRGCLCCLEHTTTICFSNKIKLTNEGFCAADGDVAMEGEGERKKNRKDVQTTETSVVNSDPLKGQYTWRIENFSQLPDRVTSDVFEIGGYQWNLLLFPRGNQSSKGQNMSLYLAVAEDNDGESFSRSAAFTLTLVSHNGESEVDMSTTTTDVTKEGHYQKESRHVFTNDQNDWGFTNFASLAAVLGSPGQKKSGFCVNDTVVIKVDVHVAMFDSNDSVYEYLENSRKETGFVGLRNQGATCYMNSLLQTLYNINEFRKAVYGLPTSEDEKPSESMPLALQSVFHMLQFTKGPVSTKDLTSSFGWDTMDAFQQHDVQELNRILCDRLEEKMKGTKVEGTINKLFEGHFTNYIDCIDIDYKSVRREAFQDVQLVVKGCKNIYDSFDEYCQVEVLEGENQYEVDGHGKQDARMGVSFESMPPVLNLQLRRFEFDFERMVMVKVNDKHEFYSEIDLDRVDPETGKPRYFSSSADKSAKNKYKLLAVLVHSGGIHGGHYYAFIRPDGENWLKFDDETVTKVSEEQAIQENWGGVPEAIPDSFGNQPRVRFSNAYMLVYVRKSEWDSIMCEVTEDDISEHIRARLRAEEEAKEKRAKERAEAHLYTNVTVTTDDDLKKQIGSSVYFDLADFNSVELSMKIPKKAKFSVIQDAVAEKYGIPVEYQRFWKFSKRHNHTIRPQWPITLSRDDTLMELADTRILKQGETAKLNLYLERLPADKDLRVPLGETTMNLYFKKYSPDSGGNEPKIEYIRQGILSRTMPMGDMVDTIKKFCGIPEDQDVLLFEEVKSEPTVMVDPINLQLNAAEIELNDGDIIIVQTACTDPDAKLPTAREYLIDIKNRANLVLKPLNPCSDKEEQESTFMLPLKKNSSYNDVSTAVAEHLKLDHPLKVQFTAQSSYSTCPRSHPIKYRDTLTLMDICKGVHSADGHNVTFVLYYQVIDQPLPEFENLVTHRITLHDSKHDEITTVTVTIPKDNTVQQLLECVRAEAKGKISAEEPLRLMEVYQWNIWHVFNPQIAVIEHLGSNSGHLRAEVIPESQRDLDTEGRLHIHCLQVEEKDSKPFPFSDPFLMDITGTETVGDLKKRVQEEMGIPDAEFADWKVVLVSTLMSTVEPLDDDVVIADKFKPLDISSERLYGHYVRPAIGFVHANKNPRRTHAHNHRTSTTFGYERALKIKA